MRVTFLGTGSAMPTGERFQTGLLLESDGNTLLVDCGSGALHGLARTAAGYEAVDAVLLTHHHLDHVSDLFPFLKARWLAGATELTVAGPGGTRELLDGLFDVHGYMRDRLDLTVRAVDAGTFSLAGFSVAATEVRHSMRCLAYRFGAGKRDPGEDGPVVFSGDTEAFRELVEFADGAAVLVHDCSFPDGVDVSNHPTPSSLGRTLAEADGEVGRVYLTHLYPHTDGRHEEMLDSVAERYDGDVRFARDGLSVDVS
ncbi:MAG: MBL fold metallo-hydrolase [Haloarculaceae archaeon]